MRECTFLPKVKNYTRPADLTLTQNDITLQATDKSSFIASPQYAHRSEKLYMQGKLMQRPKTDKSTLEVELEKNADQLTFHPQINKKAPNHSKNNSISIKNADKVIQRMKKGRELVQEAKRKLEKNLYNENDSKLPPFRFTLDKPKKANSKPPQRNTHLNQTINHNTTQNLMNESCGHINPQKVAKPPVSRTPSHHNFFEEDDHFLHKEIEKRSIAQNTEASKHSDVENTHHVEAKSVYNSIQKPSEIIEEKNEENKGN